MFAWGYAHRSQPSGVRQMVIAGTMLVLVLALGLILNHITTSLLVGNSAHVGGFLTGLAISSLALGLRSRRAAQPASAANGSPPVQKVRQRTTDA